MFKVKHAYEKPSARDGARILVDRLWPRGLSKEKLHLHSWEKDLAPSTKLRTWFSHDLERWSEFKRRYRQELKAHEQGLRALRAFGTKHTVTLLYSAKDEEHNNALALKEILGA